MRIDRRCVLAGLMGSSASLVAHPTRADAFPQRRVALVVPFPAGGPVDITAREVAAKLSDYWKQTVLVENRPGADGVLGAQTVAQSAPDGYTVLVDAIHHTVHPSIKGKLPYDLLTSFAPVSGGTVFPIIICANKTLPVGSVAELIAYAKAHPGKLSFGSAGVGGGSHLAGELFKSLAKVDLLHVAHRGSAPAMTSLLGNHVQLMFADAPTAVPQMEAGTVKALAVGSPQRTSLAPDLPTVIEAGLPGYDAYSWAGFVAPAGVPEPILAALNAGIVRALSEEDTRAKLRRIGAEPAGSTRDAFASFQRAEIAKWAKVVADAGIKVDG